MARLYKAAGHYQKALTQYQSVRDSAYSSDASTYNDEELEMLTQAKFGMARSYHHLGKYKRAIVVADSLLSDERHVAGGHMLVAMSKQNTAASVITKPGRSFSTTLLGAIQVMYQGVV
jgi:hypothetical protein